MKPATFLSRHSLCVAFLGRRSPVSVTTGR